VAAIAATSEPAPGSVRPKQPSFAPVACGTSQRCFCSSEPCFCSDREFRPTWTEMRVRKAASPRSISSQISASVTKSSPAPAYSSAIGAPSRPSSAIPLDDAHVEPMGDVVRVRHGDDPGVDELAHRLLDRALLVRQVEVDAGGSDGAHAGGRLPRVDYDLADRVYRTSLHVGVAPSGLRGRGTTSLASVASASQASPAPAGTSIRESTTAGRAQSQPRPGTRGRRRPRGAWDGRDGRGHRRPRIAGRQDPCIGGMAVPFRRSG
jgi:hypothetical protein